MPERTPLFETLERAGEVFEEDAGWMMPAHFGNLEAEYRHARSEAVLFDVSHRGKVELSGPDAASFLHNLSTNEVKKLSVGSGCEAFLTTGQAKIVAHTLIFHLPSPSNPEVGGVPGHLSPPPRGRGDGGEGAPAPDDSFWLDLVPGLAAPVLQHLDRHLISEQVGIADRTREFGQLLVVGPRAKAILEKVLQDAVPEPNGLNVWTKPIDSAIVCQVRINDALGLPGFDVVCPTSCLKEIWQRFHSAGVRDAGLRCYHTLRVEAGTPAYGVDIDETNLPQEVGRTDRTVSFTKGCYIGQETIARIRTYGHVNRSLVGLKLTGKLVVPARSQGFFRGQGSGPSRFVRFLARSRDLDRLGLRSKRLPGTGDCGPGGWMCRSRSAALRQARPPNRSARHATALNRL